MAAEEIQLDDGDRWSSMVASVVEVVQRRVDETRRPTWNSRADRERRECLSFLDSVGDPWTEGPYQEAWDLNELLVRGTLQQGRSLATILRHEPEASLSLDVIARTILELVSQATWLSDFSANASARVARSYILRRSSNSRFLDTLSKVGVDPSEVTSETPSGLDVMYAELGYSINFGPNGGWKGAYGEENAGYADRIKNYMEAFGKGPNKSIYAYMSGAAHGEIWRLAHSFQQEVDPDGALSMINPPYRLHSKLSVITSIEATFWAGYKRFQIFDQGAALTEMERMLPALRRMLVS